MLRAKGEGSISELKLFSECIGVPAIDCVELINAFGVPLGTNGERSMSESELFSKCNGVPAMSRSVLVDDFEV